MAEALELFLVEDDDDIAYVIRACLERAGHRVTVCRSGADALIVLSHRQFHLVLLDYRLDPEMTGLDLLKALHREGISTPVLMVTGFGDEKLATDVLRAGAVDYVSKTSKDFLTELPKRVVESVTRYRLQQSNHLLIAALESARDGIFITDLQGKVLHVNGALGQMFGFDRAELLGQHASILAGIGQGEPETRRQNIEGRQDPPLDPRLARSGAELTEGQPFGDEMWRALQARSSWQGELASRRKDGTRLDTSLTVSPIFDARGQMTHFVGIYRDLGERKQMERQLFQAQKMQSVGTLAGGVAHEFNNLLAGIQGYAALALRETGLSQTVRLFLDSIVQLSDRAAHLTRQLLAFARKPALSRQPAVIARLLTSTADLVRRSLNIEVVLDLGESMVHGPVSSVVRGPSSVVKDKDEEPPADRSLSTDDGPRTTDETGPRTTDEQWMALADTNQLQQVLINLCMNARDALGPRPPAPIMVRLRQRTLSTELAAFPQNVPPGDYVVIEVEDSGSGMSTDVLNQALDPFFTTKEVGQGTGLGLPVAFGIITGHHGFLTITSRVDEGTCVRIYLPRLSGDAAPAQTLEGVCVLEPENTPSRHILVVDDEEAVADVIRRFLAIAGHQVTCVSSGERAMDFLAEHEVVDLVILDLMIPHEDGVSNYRRVRERCPTLPILLCTGLVQGSEISVLQEQGEAALLRKPFRMNELWYAVNSCLRGSTKA